MEYILNGISATFIKMKLVFHAFFTEKAILLLPATTVPLLIDTQLAILILFGLICIDFATGIWASSVEKKEAEKEQEESEVEINEKDLIKNKNLISSEKARRTGVKFAIYSITILVACIMEEVFFLKPVSIGFSTADFKISIVIICFWCAVEFYSIIFENFKKIGFDVVKILTNILKKYKETKKIVTNE
ncbi:phage holin family protein [Tenacibaculum piscium]|uniref:phage holin family protein n=1 Tax=Tenacibaculum piscium TaxID=1458515 RepID=UPI0023B95275|nr:phage holin family protein [Tenacibaculum piscium]